MIEYDLAKQLRDAGFPQTPTHGIGCWWTWEGYVYKAEKDIPKKYRGVWFLNPTLTELINACGDQFFSVMLTDGLWSAHGLRMHVGGSAGTSPDSVVARLWLRMKEKGLLAAPAE
jgi:hypothetical protein